MSFMSSRNSDHRKLLQPQHWPVSPDKPILWARFTSASLLDIFLAHELYGVEFVRSFDPKAGFGKTAANYSRCGGYMRILKARGSQC